MTVPGIGPIISSAMIAAIGNGAACKSSRVGRTDPTTPSAIGSARNEAIRHSAAFAIIFGIPAQVERRSLRVISCAGCSLPSAPELVVIITWSDEDRVASNTAQSPRDVLLHLSRHLAELDHPRRRSNSG